MMTVVIASAVAAAIIASIPIGILGYFAVKYRSLAGRLIEEKYLLVVESADLRTCGERLTWYASTFCSCGQMSCGLCSARKAWLIVTEKYRRKR